MAAGESGSSLRLAVIENEEGDREGRGVATRVGTSCGVEVNFSSERVEEMRVEETREFL